MILRAKDGLLSAPAILLFFVCLICTLLPTLGVAATRDLAGAVNITQSNTKTVLDSRTQQFTTTTTLHLENTSNERIAGPIRVYPNVTVTGSAQAVEIPSISGIDSENGLPYFDLQDRLGLGALGPGRTVSFEVRFIYSRLSRIAYDPRAIQILPDIQDMPPRIVSQPVVDAEVQKPYSYPVRVEDDGDLSQLNYALVLGPSGMQISALGEVSWLPTTLQVGVHQVRLSVRDGAGNTAEQAYSVEVKRGEVAASIVFLSVPATEASVNEHYEYLALARSSQGNPLEYHLIVGPQGMTADAQSGRVEWRPSVDDVGANPVVIRATDADGNKAEQSFSIQVAKIIEPVRIVSSPVTSVQQFKRYEYQLAVEPLEGTKHYSLVHAPAGASVSVQGKIQWTPDIGYVEPNDSANRQCSIEPSPLGGFDPVLKWHWSGGQVRHTPLVAQLSDDNGDGLIDERDRPDVVFIAYQANLFNEAWIEVLDGTSGIPLETFVKPSEFVHAYGQLALGDIDNDGVIDIVATTASGHLVAYGHTGGMPKWRVKLPTSVNIMNHVALADLDGDGSTEILLGKAVFNNQGVLLWQGAGRSLGSSSASCGPCNFQHGSGYNHASVAMDILDEYPGQEVIVGNQVYSASGALIWSGSGPDGFAAVGDVDNDGLAEIVVDAVTGTYVYENTGDLKWYYSHISGGAPPTLADIDGDGYLEIGVASKPYYTVLNHDKSLLWRVNVEDGSSGITGSTVFDFEGDGKADIVYFDEDFLRVYDEKGAVKFSIPNNSGTWTEYPVVVDLDNDGYADILIPSSDSNRVSGAANTTVGVRAFRDANNSWMGTRAIWNQHAYHIDNILDNGAIPAVPEKSYRTHNTFRLSTFPDRNGTDRTDIALSNLRLNRNGARHSVGVDVVNRSSIDAISPGVLRVFNGDPARGDMLFEQSVGSLSANQRVEVDVAIDPLRLNSDVVARFDYNGRIPECHTGNNVLRAALVRARVQDTHGHADEQVYLISVKNVNEPPVITSQPSTTTIWGNPYRYEVKATDVDVADALKFELRKGPTGMQIHAQTGVITWSPALDQLGTFDVEVNVSDLEGQNDVQAFSVHVAENPQLNRAPVLTTPPDIYHTYRRSFSRLLQATDPDGDRVRFALVSGPAGMNLLSGGLLTFSEAATRLPGVTPFLVRLTDAKGLSNVFQMNLWITETAVTEGSLPPQLVSQDNDIVFLANANNAYALPMPDVSDGFHYSIAIGPAGLTVDGNVLRWMPRETDIGIHPLSMKISNGVFSYAYGFNLHVRTSENVGPQMDVSQFPGELYVNEPFAFTFNPRDPEGDAVSLTITNLPRTATVDANYQFRWTPSTADVGPRNLIIAVADNFGRVATFTLSFQVKLHRNNPPQYVQLAPKNFASIGRDYGYQFIVTDPDNDAVTFELLSGPPGMTISESGYLALASVPATLRGEYSVEVIVRDGNGGTNVATFPLRIDFNQPPVISTLPMTAAYVGERYSYGIRATDPEGYVLTYTLANAPQGMTLESSTGALSWRPSAQQVGVHPVQLIVRDDQNGEQRQHFEITVYPARIMHRNVCLPGDDE